jgi:hypothetical protein
MNDAGARAAGSYGLLALGAAVAGFYVVAQLIQQVIVRFMLPDAPDVAAEIASRLVVSNRVRQAVVLASIFLVPLAYAALASARWRYAPGAVIAGLMFGLLFAAFESAYRSIDLFAVGAWAAEFVATTDPIRRDAQLERFMLWDGVVTSLYLPLLAAHALSCAAFAAAVGSGGRNLDRWDRVLAVALGLNALRGILRMLQMHAGVTALGPINGALYLPVTLLTYGMLSAWLARAALRVRRSDDRSAAGA